MKSWYSRSLQKPITRLEVPLAALGLAGFFQRHHARAARVEVLHEALDGAALAGGVAALEDDDHPLAGFLDPVLQLQQFDLQLELVLLVGGAAQQVLVGIAAVAPVGRQGLVRVRLASGRAGATGLERLAQGLAVVGRGAVEQCAQRAGALTRTAGRRVVDQPQCRLRLRVARGGGGVLDHVAPDGPRPQGRRGVAQARRAHLAVDVIALARASGGGVGAAFGRAALGEVLC